VGKLEGVFHDAVDDYVEACAKVGTQPDKVFSGQVMFRVDPSVHARAAMAAQLRGISLNQWAEEAIRARAKVDLAE
jgi:predicted HicB family RNase H-like nuclease